jgi:hypothetical protein
MQAALKKREDELIQMEEAIITKLITSKMLIVLDHFNNSAPSVALTDIKLFLARLMDRCRNVKVMLTTYL